MKHTKKEEIAMEKESKLKNLFIILTIILLCVLSFTFSFFINKGL